MQVNRPSSKILARVHDSQRQSLSCRGFATQNPLDSTLNPTPLYTLGPGRQDPRSLHTQSFGHLEVDGAPGWFRCLDAEGNEYYYNEVGSFEGLLERQSGLVLTQGSYMSASVSAPPACQSASLPVLEVTGETTWDMPDIEDS